MRLFQSLLAASATRWREGVFRDFARPALIELESIAPKIVAPEATDPSFGFRMYVPNNSGDLMTAAWARGDTETTMAKYRVEKDVRPTRLSGEAVHYLFPISDDAEFAKHRQTLIDAARSITHLGWGIDMVAGDARVVSEAEAAKLEGERWEPVAGGGGTPLRVPRKGTLDDLIRKHDAFLHRLSDGGFRPVPPLREFDIVTYRRITDSASRPFAAFRLASIDPDDRPPSFNTARKGSHVAARLRHAAGVVCERWPAEWPMMASFVHGHDPNDSTVQLKGEDADRRFMYLPLPSIERRGELGENVGDIRRVLIAAPAGCEEQVDWVRQRLPGQELVHPGEKPVMLLPLQPDDWVLRRYVGESRVWSTVTPMVWPWHDDRDASKAESILRRAFQQAGVQQEIEAVEWGGFGYRRGVEPGSRYEMPDKLGGRRHHVRVRFKQKVCGPLAIGAGRYRGMGVFAIE
jgi:CRISPR-associated protein Csb2